MALETSIPKYLNDLQVTTDSVYKGKQMASAVVADLLRVQQPLASEVAVNYGGTITSTAYEVAAQYPTQTQPPRTDRSWLDTFMDWSTS